MIKRYVYVVIACIALLTASVVGTEGEIRLVSERPIYSIRDLREHLTIALRAENRYFREDRPRLYATKAEIERVRAAVLEDDLYAAWALGILQRADGFVGQPLNAPDWEAAVNRDRSEVQFVGRDLKGRLESLGFAFLLTGQERYAETARTLMLQVAAWPRWTHSTTSWERWTGETNTNYKAMLPTGEITKAMGTAYDWLYHYLSEDERAAVRAAIVQMGIWPIVHEWADQSTRIHEHPWNNWYAVILGGGGTAALAMLGEEPEAEMWIAMLQEALTEWFEFTGGHQEYWFGKWNDTAPNFDPDGMYGEGYTYLNYGMSYALYFAMGLADVLGDTSLAQMPQLANLPRMILYGTYFGIDGPVVVNFNDAGHSPPAADVLAGLATLLQSRELQWYFTRTRLSHSDPHALLWYDPTLEPLPPLESDAFSDHAVRFRTFGWALARTGWGSRDVLFALKSGRYVSHAHKDAAGFIYYARGIRFLIDSNLRTDYTDPIYRTYDIQTRAHNTLLVDGTGQTGFGRLGEFVTVPRLTYVRAIAGPAYNSLRRFDRHAILFGQEGYLAILDEIDSPTAVSTDWLIHTADMTAPKAIENRFTVEGGRFDLGGTVVAPSEFTFRTMPVSAERPETFLSISAPRTRGERHYLVLLTPYERRLGAPVIISQSTDESNRVIVQGASGTTYVMTYNPTKSLRTWKAPIAHASIAMATDARIAFGAIDTNGNVTEMCMVNGTQMTFSDLDLAIGQKHCAVAVHYAPEGETISLDCAAESVVHIALPAAPEHVDIHRTMGERILADWEFNAQTNRITLRVPQGETTVRTVRDVSKS